jgi:hypothetical protein
MYYHRKGNVGTPQPFCELRAYVITKDKLVPSGVTGRGDDNEVMPDMDFMLEYLEWLIHSVAMATIKAGVFYQIEGKEKDMWLDVDEAVADLGRSGISNPIGSIIRYFRLEQRNSRSREYNEAKLREVQVEREREARVERTEFGNIVPETSFIEFLIFKYGNGMISGDAMRVYAKKYKEYMRGRK